MFAKFDGKSLSLVLVLLAIVAAGVVMYGNTSFDKSPLKIGVVHALSGTMAQSETPLVAMVKMAADEINAAGGVLGRPLEVLVRDSSSNPTKAARLAEQLIIDDHVEVLFGCWTSACRKAVKPVVESYNHLLFYPLQHEGMEQSHNIIYTGAVPNQQIIPASVWAMKSFGPKVFLVGSDNLFPRVANLIVNDVVRFRKGEVVGEHYIPLGGDQVDTIIKAILDSGPDVIMNSINGDSNIAFFKALATLTKQGVYFPPVVSFSVSEADLINMPDSTIIEHYAAWNYFQTVGGAENKKFVARALAYLPPGARIGDPMESAYVGVKLWAQAVQQTATTNIQEVREAIKRGSIQGPGGLLSMDMTTSRLWKRAHIGKATPDGYFEQVWASESILRPQVFPVYRPKVEWLQLIDEVQNPS